MTLKSIDMQLALSRTAETGNIQNQLTHKPMDDHAAMAAQMQKQLEAERKKSARVDHSPDLNVHDDQSDRQQQSNAHNAKSAKTAEDDTGKSEHPFKGHHIDISL